MNTVLSRRAKLPKYVVDNTLVSESSSSINFSNRDMLKSLSSESILDKLDAKPRLKVTFSLLQIWNKISFDNSGVCDRV